MGKSDRRRTAARSGICSQTANALVAVLAVAVFIAPAPTPAASQDLPGAYHTDDCAVSVLVYGDEVITLVPATDSLPLKDEGTGSANIPLPQASYDLSDLVDGGTLRRGYLEIDVEVPHSSYPVSGSMVLADQFGRAAISVSADEDQQTRFVLGGDTLINRIRVEVGPSNFQPNSGAEGDYTDVRYLQLARGGDTSMSEVSAEVIANDMKWRVHGLRVRAGCKECGESGLGFQQGAYLIPLLPPRYDGEHYDAVYEAVHVLGNELLLSEDAIDVRAAVDPGCNCLYHYDAVVTFELLPRSGSYPLTYVELVTASESTVVWQVPVPASAGASAPNLWTWRDVTITIPGTANKGIAEWSDLRLRFKRGGSANPSTVLSVVPSLRNARFVATATEAEVLATRVLERPVVWSPHTPIVSDPDDLEQIVDDTPHGTMKVDPDDAVDPGGGEFARLDWFDFESVLSTHGSDCIANLGFPLGCDDVYLALSVRMLDATPMSADESGEWTLTFEDTSGGKVPLAFTLTGAQMQPLAGNAWTRVSVKWRDAARGPPGPTIDWENMAQVTLVSPLPVLGPEDPVPDDYYSWRVEIKQVSVQTPQRVGHDWTPGDDADDDACQVGWDEYSGLRRNYPVRFSHCFECCCYFDHPETGEKHCYEQEDVLQVVTPSVAGGVNEACRVCNREDDPYQWTERTNLFDVEASVPCDDEKSCTYDDRCISDGTCTADPYLTCLNADFTSDPTQDCEVCDGTGPFSVTRGCVAKDGDYFVYNAGTDDRACGCFLDGQIWAHGTIDPDQPCMICDVTVSTTAWTPLPDDTACDITVQADWQQTSAQSCSSDHVCSAGVCGGPRYVCAPLDACEAVNPSNPRICDMAGNSSDSGGCVREVLPTGVRCNDPWNGCTPFSACDGVDGTCPPLQQEPGTIFSDEGKSIDVVLPDGALAHPSVPAIPNTDYVQALLHNYRVQCDNLWVQMAVIADGLCLSDSVSDGPVAWGGGSAAPTRGVYAIAPRQTDLFVIGGVGSLASLATVGDAATASGVLPLDVTDLSGLLSPACHCLEAASFDVDVLLAGDAEDGASPLVSGGYLVDAAGNQLAFSFSDDGRMDQVANTWISLSGPVPAAAQDAFDFAHVVSWSLDPAGEFAGDAYAPFATVRDLRLRVGVSAPCRGIEIVPASAPVALSWDEDLDLAEGLGGPDDPHDRRATGTLDSAVDLTQFWSNRTRSFEDVVVTAEVRVRGHARPTVLMMFAASAGEGLTIPLPDVGGLWQRDWIPFRLPLRASMWPLSNSADTWSTMDRVAVQINASTAVHTQWEAESSGEGDAPIEVRNVRVRMATADCFSPTHVRGAAEATIFREGGSDWRDAALVLRGDISSPVFLHGPMSSEIVDLRALDVSQLQYLYDEDCQCFPEAYLELEVSFENRRSLIAAVMMLDANGDGLRVPVAVDADNVQVGLVRRNTITVPLEPEHVVGPPSGEGLWNDVTVLQFERTSDSALSARDVGTVVVHSMSVKSYGVPCSEDGELAPGGLRLWDLDVKLAAVDGGLELRDATMTGTEGPATTWASSLRHGFAADAVVSSRLETQASYGTAVVAEGARLIVVGGSLAPTATIGGDMMLEGVCNAQRGCGVIVAKEATASLLPAWARVVTGVGQEDAGLDTERVAGLALLSGGTRFAAAGWVEGGFSGSAIVNITTPAGESVYVHGEPLQGRLDAYVVVMSAMSGDVVWLSLFSTSKDDMFNDVSATADTVLAVGQLRFFADEPPVDDTSLLAGTRYAGLAVAFDASHGDEVWRLAVGHSTDDVTVTFSSVSADENADLAIISGDARSGRVEITLASGETATLGTTAYISGHGDTYSFVLGVEAATGVVHWAKELSAASLPGSSLTFASAGTTADANGVYLCASSSLDSDALDAIASGASGGATSWYDGDRVSEVSTSSDALIMAVSRTDGHLLWSSVVSGGLSLSGSPTSTACTGVTAAHSSLFVTGSTVGGLSVDVHGPDGARPVSFSTSDIPLDTTAGLLLEVDITNGNALGVEVIRSDADGASPLVTIEGGVATVGMGSHSTGAAGGDASGPKVYVHGTFVEGVVVGNPAAGAFSANEDHTEQAAFVAVASSLSHPLNRDFAESGHNQWTSVPQHGGTSVVARYAGHDSNHRNVVITPIDIASGDAFTLVVGQVMSSSVNDTLLLFPLGNEDDSFGMRTHPEREYTTSYLGVTDRVTGDTVQVIPVVSFHNSSTVVTCASTTQTGTMFVVGGYATNDIDPLSVLGTSIVEDRTDSTERFLFAVRGAAVPPEDVSDLGGADAIEVVWTLGDSGDSGDDRIRGVATSENLILAVGDTTSSESIAAEMGDVSVTVSDNAQAGSMFLVNPSDGQVIRAGYVGGYAGTEVTLASAAIGTGGATLYVMGQFRGNDMLVDNFMHMSMGGVTMVEYPVDDDSRQSWAGFVAAYSVADGSLSWITSIGGNSAHDVDVRSLIMHQGVLLAAGNAASPEVSVRSARVDTAEVPAMTADTSGRDVSGWIVSLDTLDGAPRWLHVFGGAAGGGMGARTEVVALAQSGSDLVTAAIAVTAGATGLPNGVASWHPPPGDDVDKTHTLLLSLVPATGSVVDNVVLGAEPTGANSEAVRAAGSGVAPVTLASQAKTGRVVALLRSHASVIARYQDMGAAPSVELKEPFVISLRDRGSSGRAMPENPDTIIATHAAMVQAWSRGGGKHLFMRTYSGTGNAFGVAASIGAKSMLVAGKFRGYYSSDDSVLWRRYRSHGADDLTEAVASDGYVSGYNRVTGELVDTWTLSTRDSEDAELDDDYQAFEDGFAASDASRDGARHFVVGHTSGGATPVTSTFADTDFPTVGQQDAFVACLDDTVLGAWWVSTAGSTSGNDRWAAVDSGDTFVLVAGSSDGVATVDGTPVFAGDIGARTVATVFSFDPADGAVNFGLAFGTVGHDGMAAVTCLSVSQDNTLVAVGGIFAGGELAIGDVVVEHPGGDAVAGFVALFSFAEGGASPAGMSLDWATSMTHTGIGHSAVRAVSLSEHSLAVTGEFSTSVLSFAADRLGAPVDLTKIAGSAEHVGFVGVLKPSNGGIKWAIAMESEAPSAALDVDIEATERTLFVSWSFSGHAVLRSFGRRDDLQEIGRAYTGIGAPAQTRGGLAEIDASSGSVRRFDVLGGANAGHITAHAIALAPDRKALAVAGSRYGALQFITAEDNYIASETALVDSRGSREHPSNDEDSPSDTHPYIALYDMAREGLRTEEAVGLTAVTAVKGSIHNVGLLGAALRSTTFLGTTATGAHVALGHSDGDEPSEEASPAPEGSVIAVHRESGAVVFGARATTSVAGETIGAVAASSSAGISCVAAFTSDGADTAGEEVTLFGVPDATATLLGDGDVIVGCFDEPRATSTSRQALRWARVSMSSDDGVDTVGAMDIAETAGTNGAAVWIGGTTTGTPTLNGVDVPNSGAGVVQRCTLYVLDADYGDERHARLFGSDSLSGSTCSVSGVAAAPGGRVFVAGTYSGGKMDFANDDDDLSLPALHATYQAASYIVQYDLDSDAFSAPLQALGGGTSMVGTPIFVKINALSLADGVLAASGSFTTLSVTIAGETVASPALYAGAHANQWTCFAFGARIGPRSGSLEADRGDQPILANAEGNSWIAVAADTLQLAQEGGRPVCGRALASTDGVRLPGGFVGPVRTAGGQMVLPHARPAVEIRGADDHYFATILRFDTDSGILVGHETIGHRGTVAVSHTVVDDQMTPASEGGGVYAFGLATGATLFSSTDGVASVMRPPRTSAHKSIVFRSHLLSDTSGLAPEGSIIPITTDATRLLSDGDECGCVAGYVLRMDVMLSDTRYPIAGGRWTHGTSARASTTSGFSFVFDEAAQRAAPPNTWVTVEAHVSESHNFVVPSRDSELAAMGAFVLERAGVPIIPAADKAGIGWRVRNALLVPKAAECAACGATRALAVEAELDTMPVIGNEAAYLRVTDGAAMPDDSDHTNLVSYPIDLSTSVDIACHCLAGATVAVEFCAGGDDDDASLPAGFDALVSGVALTNADGTIGVVAATVADGLDAVRYTGRCVTKRFAVRASDHREALSTEWENVAAVRIIGDHAAAAIVGVPTLLVRAASVERACAADHVTAHPSPTTGASTMRMDRVNIALEHGASYRLITREFNVWGDEGAPVCSDAFIVDTTPPEVGGNSVFDLSVEDAAAREDITYTRHFDLAVGWDAATFMEAESSPADMLIFAVGAVSTGGPDGPWIDGVDAAFSEVELPRTGSGEATSNELPLEDGVEYFVHLFVMNPARLYSELVSNGIVHDSSAPVPSGTIRDVDPADPDTDIDHQVSLTSVHVAWEVFEDPHTALAEVAIGLGTAADNPDTIAFQLIGLDDTAHTFSVDPPLVVGQHYFAVFRVTNVAGAQAVYASDGIYPDVSPPYPLWVNDIWFMSSIGIDTLEDDDANTGDIDMHNGRGIVKGKWKCDDDESVGDSSRGTMTYMWRVCDSSACEGTVYFEWMDAGASTTAATSTGLPMLPEGSQVFIEVECMNPVGFMHTFSSDGVTVTAGQPDSSSAAAFDLDPDADVYDATADVATHDSAVLRASWNGFATAGGVPGVKYYEVAWGTSAGGNSQDLVPWTYAGLELQYTTDSGVTSLTDGATYYATVRAVTNNGETAFVATDGVLSDQSPPEGAIVTDIRSSDPPAYCPSLSCVAIGGTTDDVNSIPNAAAVAAFVSGEFDSHSGVAQYRWGVSPCSNLYSFTTSALGAPGTSELNIAIGHGLFHGVKYCTVVEITNTAGASAMFSSDGFTVDLTAPTFDYANDGITVDVAVDIDFVTDTETAAVSYQCTDLQSPIDHYEVSLVQMDANGDAANEIVSPTNVGLDTVTSFSGIGLVNGGLYQAVVTCYNIAGLHTTKRSDGFLVDTTPPDTGSMVVWHGPRGLVVSYDPLTSTITASWSPDSNEDLAGYSWAVGTMPGASDVVPVTDVGDATSTTKSNAAVDGGNTVYVSVIVRDAHDASATLTMTGLTIENSPAHVGVVTVDSSTENELAYISSHTAISAAWGDGLPGGLGDVTFEWAIGVTKYGEETMPYKRVGTATEDTQLGLSLAAGATYYVSVRAVNPAGNPTNIASNRAFVDPYAPNAGRVYSGATPATAVTMLNATDEFDCSWEGFADTLSGLAELHVGVGTIVNIADTVSFSEVALDATSKHFTDLSLAAGSRYYCVVKAVDMADAVTTASSDSVVIDTTPPLVGTLADGFEALDADYQHDRTKLRAHWSGWDDFESGVASQYWTIGTSNGGEEILEWAELDRFVQSATYEVPDGTQLSESDTYYVSLRVTNAVGDTSQATTDGIQMLIPGSPRDSAFEFDPDVVVVPLFQSEPSANAGWCTCLDPDSAGVVFDGDRGSCSCPPGEYYDAQDARCEDCPATSPCKPKPGNAMHACRASFSCAPNSVPEPLDLEELDGEVCATPDSYPPRFGKIPEDDDTDEDGCGCAPGSFLDTLPVTPECNICGPRSDGYYKSTLSDALSECRRCWSPSEPDGVLQVDWEVPGAESDDDFTSGEMRVYVGLTANDRRWVRIVASDGTRAQFSARTYTAADGTNLPGLPFEQGAQFYITLELVETSSGDVATEEIRAWARQVTSPIDITPAVAGPVVDGGALVDACGFSSSALEATWHSWEDPESGIDHYEVAVGTAGTGSSDVSGGWVDVSLSETYSIADAAVSNGDVVTTTVRAYNGVGAVTQHSSDGAVVHTAVPGGYVVIRGDVPAGARDAAPFPHIRAPRQQSVDRVLVGWLFGSGSVPYDPCVALTYTWWLEEADDDGEPSGTVVQTEENVGSRTEVEATGLNLTPGSRYVVLVRATSALGVSETAHSSPVLVDDSAPHSGWISVTPVPDPTDLGPTGQVFQSSNDTMQLSWSFDEPDVTIDIVSIAVGSVSGGEQIMVLTDFVKEQSEDVDLDAQEATLRELDLRQGHCYYAHVSTTNNVSLGSDTVVTPPLCIDQTTPELGVDVTATSGPATADTDAGIAAAEVHAGHWLAAAAEHGRVRQALLTSRGILLQHANSDFPALVSIAHDRDSGLSSVEVAISTSTDVLDDGALVHAWEAIDLWDVGVSGAATLYPSVMYEDLEPAQVYYAMIRSTNRASLTSGVVSVPFLIDDSPPVVTNVAVNEFQMSDAVVDATWDVAEEESVILSLAWAIVDSEGSVAMPSTPVGLAARATASDLTLTSGETYTIVVSACNVLGLCALNADASFTVDTSAPIGGTVVLVPGDDVALVDIDAVCGDVEEGAPLCAMPSAFYLPPVDLPTYALVWGAFEDGQTEIVGYEVSVGTTPLGVDVVAPVATEYDETMLNFTLWLPFDGDDNDGARAVTRGRSLFVAVTAFNVVGLHSRVVAELALFDAVSPSAEGITFVADNAVEATLAPDGLVVNLAVGTSTSTSPLAQSIGDAITVAWQPFEDGSGLDVAYQLQLFRMVGEGAWFGPPGDDKILSTSDAVRIANRSIPVGDAVWPAADDTEFSFVWNDVVAADADSANGGLFSACIMAADEAGNTVSMCTPRPLAVDASPPAMTSAGGPGSMHVSESAGDLDRDCMPRTGTPIAHGVHVIVGEGAVAPGGAASMVDVSMHTVIPAMWPPFQDVETGVASVFAGLGTAPGNDDVVAFSIVPGRANTAQFVLPAQTEGAVLYTSVKATNSAGLESSAVTSDGVRILCTPGSPGCEYDGFFLCQPGSSGMTLEP